ncbi:helix-turn-helix transcriptional regulator [Thermomonas sp.]|uniref:helix-turn-helix transcriptional regulator n=1 Tax=Thermomonas sp. TaxID=1971895 RepID=UPI0035AF9E62
MVDEAGMAVARQWAMLKRVPRSPLKITTKELEGRLLDEGFQVSRRTIERDLHLLAAEFPLVLDDRSKPYGWSWAKDAHFEFMPRLTTPQAVALQLARTHLRNLLPQAMHKELAPIFDSASRTLSGSGWKDWHKRTAVVPMGIPHIPPKLSTDVLMVVQSALAHRRCIQVQYRAKGSRQGKETKIHPLGLLSRGPVVYLVCTLFDYGDVRQLALHRMDAPVEMDVRSKEPAGFDFQEYVSTEARRYGSGGKIKLVVRFDATAAEHLREMPISIDQLIHDMADGRVEVSATVEDDELLRWWLLGFGRWVEVVGPVRLRAELADELRAASSTYQRSEDSY